MGANQAHVDTGGRSTDKGGICDAVAVYVADKYRLPIPFDRRVGGDETLNRRAWGRRSGGLTVGGTRPGARARARRTASACEDD